MIEEKNTSRTPIYELGEFGLIEHLTKEITPSNRSSHLGIGDDAAIISPSSNKELLVTTDLLVEGIHFNLQYCPLKHLGYKAVVVNISDIVAMGGTPKQILVALAISNKYTVEALEEIYLGIKLACKNYGVDLIGGDTSSSPTGMCIAISAIGEVRKGKAIKRSGAKINELIAVSGNLGAAYMGLQILERENTIYQNNPNIQPDLSEYPYLLERQLKPEARMNFMKSALDAKIPISAAIDISDGLSSELIHLSKASKVGTRIFENKIPIDLETQIAAESFKIPPLLAALNGGEDYELLITIPLSYKDAIEKLNGWRIIGHTTDISLGNKLVCNDSNLSELDLSAKGWDSFTNHKEE